MKFLTRKTQIIWLLAIMVSIAIFTNGRVYAASDDDNSWAQELTTKSQEMVWKNLEEKYQELLDLENPDKKSRGKTITERSEDKFKFFTNNTELKIFVSTTMPINLLRQYAKEAENYDAALIFKGLPGGSFKELISLITEIQSEEGKAAILIDDEAFDRFAIHEVPSLLLSKKKDCLPYQNCGYDFDVIKGNISIKAALEKFADSGDLRKEAREILAR